MKDLLYAGYPIIKDFYPSANGNWDASMLQTMLAMGVYLDDQSMFELSAVRDQLSVHRSHTTDTVPNC